MKRRLVRLTLNLTAFAAAAMVAATPIRAQEATNTAGGPALSTKFYEIVTRHGSIIIQLYGDTPKHSENFAKLVDEGFYDGTLFHRVIANFMIQGGDPNSKNSDPLDNGQGGPGYTVPAEIDAARYHKRGAVAGARQADQVNPGRASSGSQFYIVHGGRTFDANVLGQLEARLKQQIPDPNFAFTPEMIEAYGTDGGAPHLDGMYTVFGEVVEGWDVLDLIGAEETPRSLGERTHPSLTDQPTTPVVMESVRALSNYTPPTAAPTEQ